jgi:hypothetical protein
LCSSREKAHNPFFSIYFFSWTVKKIKKKEWSFKQLLNAFTLSSSFSISPKNPHGWRSLLLLLLQGLFFVIFFCIAWCYLSNEFTMCFVIFFNLGFIYITL